MSHFPHETPMVYNDRQKKNWHTHSHPSHRTYNGKADKFTMGQPIGIFSCDHILSNKSVCSRIRRGTWQPITLVWDMHSCSFKLHQSTPLIGMIFMHLPARTHTVYALPHAADYSLHIHAIIRISWCNKLIHQLIHFVWVASTRAYISKTRKVLVPLLCRAWSTRYIWEHMTSLSIR